MLKYLLFLWASENDFIMLWLMSIYGVVAFVLEWKDLQNDYQKICDLHDKWFPLISVQYDSRYFQKMENRFSQRLTDDGFGFNYAL